MSNHPYNNHREQQVAHRRVNTILAGSPAGATKHMQGPAFSKITSKSAAARDDDIRGAKSKPGKYARGGKVKGGNTTVNIVIPGAGAGAKPPMPLPVPMAGPPMGGPPPGPPPMPPPMPMGGPPGLPMRASGGRIKDGKSGGMEKAMIKQSAARAKANSRIGKMTGGAITGVGRLEKAGKK